MLCVTACWLVNLSTQLYGDCYKGENSPCSSGGCPLHQGHGPALRTQFSSHWCWVRKENQSTWWRHSSQVQGVFFFTSVRLELETKECGWEGWIEKEIRQNETQWADLWLLWAGGTNHSQTSDTAAKTGSLMLLDVLMPLALYIVKIFVFLKSNKMNITYSSFTLQLIKAYLRPNLVQEHLSGLSIIRKNHVAIWK